MKQLGHKKFNIKSRIEQEARLLQPVIESGKFTDRQVFEAWQNLFELVKIEKSDNDPFTPGLTMYGKFDALYEKVNLTEPIFGSGWLPKKKTKAVEKKEASAPATGSLDSFIS